MFLVVGATGELGGRIFRILRADVHDVRCLVRAGSDDAGLREVAAIARILAGARTPTIRQTDEIGMLALVDAAESAGVQRFVHKSFPAEHAIVTPMERAKLAVEKCLGTSSMRTVILRSDAFHKSAGARAARR